MRHHYRVTGVGRIQELAVDGNLSAEARAWYHVGHPDESVKGSSDWRTTMNQRCRVDESMDQPPVMGLLILEHRESNKTKIGMCA